jgi:hypothetical protein
LSWMYSCEMHKWVMWRKVTQLFPLPVFSPTTAASCSVLFRCNQRGRHRLAHISRLSNILFVC